MLLNSYLLHPISLQTKYSLIVTTMQKKLFAIIVIFGLLNTSSFNALYSQAKVSATITNETLLYHPIQINSDDSTILSWYSTDDGKSCDFVINAVWDFWFSMRTDKNGLPYYMNHQVWRPDFNDRRGVGGDQFAMALSSWNLLYAYSGNENIKEEMKFIADYYISHSLSPDGAVWPNLPYPYNTLIYSGQYDGDMVIGKDFTQPDKAGSFGLELVKLYKMTNARLHPIVTDKKYLDAAVKIANTLASHTMDGDNDKSPLPFKVNAINGETGKLKDNSGTDEDIQLSSYTANWSGTLELFLSLIELNSGNVPAYKDAFNKILSWMKKYPLKTNKWGPFFEDIPGWSDTQINAVTFAQFMMNHKEYFPDWQTEVKGIFSWVYEVLGNKEWEKYGVIVVNEQTAYQTPGNSHTSRQASAELQYAFLTGDNTYVKNAVRQLSWATYMVDNDGKNCYPRDEIWLTDGYGDYVRHFLRAMSFWPELAPLDKNHLLSTTSVIQRIEYAPDFNKFLVPDIDNIDPGKVLVNYHVFDKIGKETLRLTEKPTSVLIDSHEISEGLKDSNDSWIWKDLELGGILTINHSVGSHIIIVKD